MFFFSHETNKGFYVPLFHCLAITILSYTWRISYKLIRSLFTLPKCLVSTFAYICDTWKWHLTRQVFVLMLHVIPRKKHDAAFQQGWEAFLLLVSESRLWNDYIGYNFGALGNIRGFFSFLWIWRFDYMHITMCSPSLCK